MKIIQIFSRMPEFSDSVPQLRYSCLDNFKNREEAERYVEEKNAAQNKDDLHRDEYYIQYVEVHEDFLADLVLVTFFKESGKFYGEENIIMPYSEEGLPLDWFEECLRRHLQGKRLNDMTAVCLNPNHKHSYPVMIRVKDIYELSGKVSKTPRA